jgi:hypothetical protein
MELSGEKDTGAMLIGRAAGLVCPLDLESSCAELGLRARTFLVEKEGAAKISAVCAPRYATLDGHGKDIDYHTYCIFILEQRDIMGT